VRVPLERRLVHRHHHPRRRRRIRHSRTPSALLVCFLGKKKRSFGEIFVGRTKSKLRLSIIYTGS
jgi:hypothetical protein